MDERIRKMYLARIGMMKVEIKDLAKEIDRLEKTVGEQVDKQVDG